MRDEGWVGRRAVDRDGAAIGVVVEVSAAPDGSRWALVRTRRVLPRHRAVPLAGARSTSRGITVAHARAAVLAAPAIDRGAPSGTEARRLTDHYAASTPSASRVTPAGARVVPQDAALQQARAEARHAAQRLDLYRAKAYGSRPTSAQRLRELERAHVAAHERLQDLLTR